MSAEYQQHLCSQLNTFYCNYTKHVPVVRLFWYCTQQNMSALFIFLILCAVLLCVYVFWVSCCDVRYDFGIKTMFGSCLPPVVCMRDHVLFTLFMFVCLLCCAFVLFSIVSCTLCCWFLWMVHIWMAPSVFSSVD